MVVPFAGAQDQLTAALARLEAIVLEDGDTFVVADNRQGTVDPVNAPPHVRVVGAHDRPGSYHARNLGAAAGSNEWIVFVDADVDPPADLIASYFDQPPEEHTAVLVGEMIDQAADGDAATLAARYQSAAAMMSQDRVYSRPEWVYAQTANCAVRRAAFDEVGGFTAEIRSGGDADLCFRLRALGWKLERRPAATVVHRSRTTMRALLRQRMRVGAGAGWLERRYPGFAPRRPLWRVFAAAAKLNLRGVRNLARGDRTAAMLDSIEGICDAAFQIGWRLPNRPLRGRR